MTYQEEFTLPEGIIQQITEQGFEYIPELSKGIMNGFDKAQLLRSVKWLLC